ncbi:LacI family DNA-binding transcriptional regulator [Thalassotalea montiporae]
MSTIYQVAKLAGCGASTVSRVINEHPSVSAKTREKVHHAMAQLQFRPNKVAKSLASKRTDCIGILVGELHSSFFGTLTGAIEGKLRAHNKHVIVTAGHSDADMEKQGIEFLIDRHCDAIVIHAEALSDEYLAELSQSNTPILIVNRDIESCSTHCVSLNNKLGGIIATQAAITAGHQNIAYISGPMRKQDARARWQGHCQALVGAAITYDPQLYVESEFSQQGGIAAFETLLKRGCQFTAVVCGSDEIACGVMAAAREAGFDLPSALSIVGFDNANIAAYTYPKLASVDYPIASIGREVANRVLNDVYGISCQQTSLHFDPVFVERESLQPIHFAT